MKKELIETYKQKVEAAENLEFDIANINNELDELYESMKAIESVVFMDVLNALDGEQKPLYSNEAKREAAKDRILREDKGYLDKKLKATTKEKNKKIQMAKLAGAVHWLKFYFSLCRLGDLDD